MSLSYFPKYSPSRPRYDYNSFKFIYSCTKDACRIAEWTFLKSEISVLGIEIIFNELKARRNNFVYYSRRFLKRIKDKIIYKYIESKYHRLQRRCSNALMTLEYNIEKQKIGDSPNLSLF